jgi:hypothetical protein
MSDKQLSLQEIGIGDVAYGLAKRAMDERWNAAKLGPAIAKLVLDFHTKALAAQSAESAVPAVQEAGTGFDAEEFWAARFKPWQASPTDNRPQHDVILSIIHDAYCAGAAARQPSERGLSEQDGRRDELNRFLQFCNAEQRDMPDVVAYVIHRCLELEPENTRAALATQEPDKEAKAG